MDLAEAPSHWDLAAQQRGQAEEREAAICWLYDVSKPTGGHPHFDRIGAGKEFGTLRERRRERASGQAAPGASWFT